jgi:hypothetical protein
MSIEAVYSLQYVKFIDLSTLVCAWSDNANVLLGDRKTDTRTKSYKISSKLVPGFIFKTNLNKTS